MRFVDTNVLLYAASILPEEEAKRLRARELLAEPNLAVSVQVLQEFYHQATRATRPGRLSDEDAVRFLDPVLEMRIQAVTLGVFKDAVSMRRRFSLSYWDAAILAAARRLGCDAVYSEDMSAEQDYGGIRVVNPF
ncbi:MAG: PIN domain-containing protein [Gemmatimonadetes bacterium]|nr:PIN domain-containing protein [Gemmatimonadota bacterium]